MPDIHWWMLVFESILPYWHGRSVDHTLSGRPMGRKPIVSKAQLQCGLGQCKGDVAPPIGPQREEIWPRTSI